MMSGWKKDNRKEIKSILQRNALIINRILPIYILTDQEGAVEAVKYMRFKKNREDA